MALPERAPALELAGVSYQIRGRRGTTPRSLLTDVSLSVSAGEAVVIMGPSGVGKSTLLSICMGLIAATTGAVMIGGHALGGRSSKELAQIRGEHLGVVFQSGELLDELTPLDNVALPALLARSGRALAYSRARELLDLMGLSVEDTPTDRLSGGERQRVALARALINAPQVILADEPTGSLDVSTRDQVADHLFGLRTTHNCALFIVTHDPAIATRADRVHVLADGHLKHGHFGVEKPDDDQFDLARNGTRCQR